MGRLSIALLHYPVHNKGGEVVTTAVVNADIHDIARTAKTFGVAKYYIITPLESQREYATKIIKHWLTGFGGTYNPARREAFSLCVLKADLSECLHDFTAPPLVVATSAKPPENMKMLSCGELAQIIKDDKRDVLLLFGTGWGLTKDILESASAILEPIEGVGEYNHLSVRAASAIIISRLMTARY